MTTWILDSKKESDGVVNQVWRYGKLYIQRDVNFHVSASRSDKKALTEKEERRIVERFDLDSHKRIQGGMLESIRKDHPGARPVVHWVDFDKYPSEVPKMYWRFRDLAAEFLAKRKEE